MITEQQSADHYARTGLFFGEDRDEAVFEDGWLEEIDAEIARRDAAGES